MRIRRFAGVAGLLAAALAVAGCGDDKLGEVTGTVTVDGEPAMHGSSISIVPADGKGTPGGGLLDGGKYDTKVAVGPAKVRVTVPKFASGRKSPAPKAGPGSGEDRVVGELELVDETGKSDLTYDVKPGRQEKNWNLKTKK